MALKHFEELRTRPSIIAKDAPIALNTQEIPRGLGAVSPGTTNENDIYLRNILKSSRWSNHSKAVHPLVLEMITPIWALIFGVAFIEQI